MSIKKAVLVVEDDQDILENLVEFLESDGYIALKAENGKRALEFLAATETLPSAIILDLMMPEMNGTQFREEQGKNPRIAKIPVILISADHQIETKKAKLGAVEFVKKPIDIDILSEVLKKY